MHVEISITHPTLTNTMCRVLLQHDTTELNETWMHVATEQFLRLIMKSENIYLSRTHEEQGRIQGYMYQWDLSTQSQVKIDGVVEARLLVLPTIDDLTRATQPSEMLGYVIRLPK